MSQSAFRSALCCLLVVVFPAQLMLSADTAAAMLYTNGAAWLNGSEVVETVGDCAYGGGPTRRAFADEERKLTAKVPVSTNGDCFSKREFAIDLEKKAVRCPAGQTTNDYRSVGEGQGGRFVFAAATCQCCSLRSQCVRGKGPRALSIQAEEDLQQRAPVHNQT